jgi:hypothetical protein
VSYALASYVLVIGGVAAYALALSRARRRLAAEIAAHSGPNRG